MRKTTILTCLATCLSLASTVFALDYPVQYDTNNDGMITMSEQECVFWVDNYNASVIIVADDPALLAIECQNMLGFRVPCLGQYCNITDGNYAIALAYMNYLSQQNANSILTDIQSRVQSIENWQTTIETSISDLGSLVSGIQAALSDHETRIQMLENATSGTSSALEARVAALESAVCSIKYADYFGFCPERCPRPYYCRSSCENDTTPSICYNRTAHPDYFCRHGRVCCETQKVDCSAFV